MYAIVQKSVRHPTNSDVTEQLYSHIHPMANRLFDTLRISFGENMKAYFATHYLLSTQKHFLTFSGRLRIADVSGTR